GGKLLVFGEFAERALTRVHIVGELLHVGNRFVGVVIKRGIFQEFASSAFSCVYVVDHFILCMFIDICLIIKLIIVYLLVLFNVFLLIITSRLFHILF